MKLVLFELYSFFNPWLYIDMHFSTVPTGVPTNVHLEMQSSGSVFLTWQPPPLSQQNGIISGYTILLTALQDGSSHVYNLTGTASSHHFEGLWIFDNRCLQVWRVDKFLVPTWNCCLGLPGFAKYQVALAAQTAVGTGPYSNVTNFTTPEGGKESLPSMPPSVDVLIKWILHYCIHMIFFSFIQCLVLLVTSHIRFWQTLQFNLAGVRQTVPMAKFLTTKLSIMATE